MDPRFMIPATISRCTRRTLPVSSKKLMRVRRSRPVMKSYGANTYRFSLAWARIIPLGGRDDPINEKGIAFYNSVIDECLKLGMTPFITLYQFVSSQCNIPELM
jgi:hypothetical protein